MHDYDLSPLLKQWIGFDRLASNIQIDQENFNFPPYNIEKYDEDHYRIVLALAGFKEDELIVEVEGPRLTIKGKPTTCENKQVHYLYQGLICKKFSLSFALAEHMLVDYAEFSNGLLSINLIRQIPESLQPRRIIINKQ
ncbi:MAG: Hsp20 family protein [Candidatus Lightella neohaematopini]|nr:Hsp20 family protein [Candidatus Lightella neohaematopini]